MTVLVVTYNLSATDKLIQSWFDFFFKIKIKSDSEFAHFAQKLDQFLVF
jgi:hypothetical protein